MKSDIGRAIVALKQELEWLERNTVGVEGERSAARESWWNVRQRLAELERAVAEEDVRCAG